MRTTNFIVTIIASLRRASCDPGRTTGRPAQGPGNRQHTCQITDIRGIRASVPRSTIILYYEAHLHGHPLISVTWRVYSRVGNGYDQAQLRSIKMAAAEYGEFRLSRIVSTQHLVRRPYCAQGESWDRLIFWVWETAAAGWDIADIGKRKFRRIDRNCHTRK